MSEPPTEQTNSPIVQDRQDLIETAIRFLNNPKVKPTPIESKKLFLSKKGLSESEINAAIQRSESTSTTQQIIHAQTETVPQIPVIPKKDSIWNKILSLFKNLIIAGCVAYAGYKLLVKKFLKKKSNKKLIEYDNEELKKSIKEINESISQLKNSIETMNGSISNLSGPKQSNEETNLKLELKSIKSLLLSRQQFPSIPAVNPIIPSWQLETKFSRENSPEKNEITKPEDNNMDKNDNNEIMPKETDKTEENSE